MSLRSSPGTYLRCSLNSTEKPWNGLACSPVRKPSTINFARRSSRATWRMTSGRRYFSALAMRSFRQTAVSFRKQQSVLLIFPQKQMAVDVEKALAVNLINARGSLGQKAAQGDTAFEGFWMMLWVNLKREDLPGGNYMVHEASETGMFFSRFQPSRPAIEFGPYP